RLVEQVLHDALARLVVDHQLLDVVALGGGVLRVEAGVEVEPRPVLEEHVGVAGAGDDLLEEIPRDVVRGEPALAVQRAGQSVLVFQPEDPPLHGVVTSGPSVAQGRASGPVRGPKVLTGRSPSAGREPPAGCGGTSDAAWCGPARRP